MSPFVLASLKSGGRVYAFLKPWVHTNKRPIQTNGSFPVPFQLSQWDGQHFGLPTLLQGSFINTIFIYDLSSRNGPAVSQLFS